MARLAGLIGAAALSLGLALPGLERAEDPVKPELGAGPHRDRSPQTSGAGERPRQESAPPAVVPKAPDAREQGGGASSGPSTSPEDERSARDREDDERKATESKDKMKKRPGYRDEVPGPRALYRI